MGSHGHGDNYHSFVFGIDQRGAESFYQAITRNKTGGPVISIPILLCAEGLSVLLRKAMANHNIEGIMTSQQGVCIFHLLFVNDSLLFCRAIVEECQNLLKLLEKYEAASGQAINR